MSAAQIWNNIVAYALQIGLLVGLTALASPLLRTPRVRLLFWQTVLVACLALPWLQTWRQEVISVSNVNALAFVGAASLPAAASSASVYHRPPFTEIVLWLIAAGIIARLTWLGVGLARLDRYRNRGRTLTSDPAFLVATSNRARWLISDRISGPVTFGWRDPVVLLPARFPLLAAELREAILCHELIHVQRRDWLFTLLEELVRAVFWFHPAVWWVLGEIQLAREQTVDREVLEITRARDPYLDALLAMANAPVSAIRTHSDPIPAPLFLRKRHLRRRIVELMRDTSMLPSSAARLVAAPALAVAFAASACWLVSGTFPLAAPPQLVADAAGVVVNTGDAKLLHRSPIAYPAEALARGIQGSVLVEAHIDAEGEVSETVVHCPRELCEAAADALPHWRFDISQANTTRIVSINFARPIDSPAVIPDSADANADA